MVHPRCAQDMRGKAEEAGQFKKNTSANFGIHSTAGPAREPKARRFGSARGFARQLRRGGQRLCEVSARVRDLPTVQRVRRVARVRPSLCAVRPALAARIGCHLSHAPAASEIASAAEPFGEPGSRW